MDAICIDQDDLVERDAQVKLMGSIYSKARQVLIWLGEGNEETDRDVLLSNEMVDRLSFYRPGIQTQQMLTAIEDAIIDVPFEHLSAFARILRRQWFERIWIVQEVVLAKDAVVLLGHQQIPWEALVRTLEAIFEVNATGTLLLEGPILGLFTPIMITHKKHNLLTTVENALLRELISTRALRSTDPRDKLFGLLGLVDKDATSDLIATYSMSAIEVFHNLTLCFYSRSGLTFLANASAVPIDHDVQTPSWVPNCAMIIKTGHQILLITPLQALQELMLHSADARDISHWKVNLSTRFALSVVT